MPDEGARHDLHRAAEQILGTAAADTLMALLPPVGRSDAATTHDLHRLDDRFEARLDVRLARERARAEARIATVDARLDEIDAGVALSGARVVRLEARFDRAQHDRVRWSTAIVLVAVVAMSALCLGAVALAT